MRMTSSPVFSETISGASSPEDVSSGPFNVLLSCPQFRLFWSRRSQNKGFSCRSSCFTIKELENPTADSALNMRQSYLGSTLKTDTEVDGAFQTSSVCSVCWVESLSPSRGLALVSILHPHDISSQLLPSSPAFLFIRLGGCLTVCVTDRLDPM